jgi:hypothetical protein
MQRSFLPIKQNPLTRSVVRTLIGQSMLSKSSLKPSKRPKRSKRIADLTADLQFEEPKKNPSRNSVFQQTSYLGMRESCITRNEESMQATTTSEYLASSKSCGTAKAETEESRYKTLTIVIMKPQKTSATDERVRKKEKFIQAKFNSLTLQTQPSPSNKKLQSPPREKPH